MASQGYHHHHHHHHQAAAGIFSFSNGFERSAINHQEQQQQLVQQIRRDKLRVQGFEPPPPPLVGIEEEESNALPVYESTGMLSSEMFYFPSSVTVTAASTELLDQSLQANYRGQLGESKNDRDSLAQQQQLPSINADSAAAMHLFLMNPQTRSPSPPPPQPQPPPRGFHGGAFPPQFTWVPDNSHEGGHGQGQGQGLSLSLSSLQHLEAAKLYYNQGGATGGADGGGGSSATATAQFQYKHDHHSPHQPLGLVQNHQVHVGYNSSLGMVNVLRNSKYTKLAQELLEEFCSVGSGRFKKKKLGKNNINPSSNPSNDGTTTNGSSSSTKDLPPFSASDRIEHQRRKVKLLSMLDEVDRRYNHYCEQMQTVVNSFDLVMGYGAAIPYTALAQKAMSRHFRCLKDAISSQLKHSCELLGEKDGVGTSGITKGETPRLRMLEQSLRQQKAFHQIGMMEHEAWRPQRGLPERSVNILRAWLFEHFLHPYPSDADKHLLARQTGLSRNQVSNWFINARVRLWKPMVEEMYQQESKEGGDNNKGTRTNNNAAQTSTPSTTAVGGAGGASPPPQPPENDPSLIGTNTTQCFSENQLTNTGTSTTNTSTATEVTPPVSDSDIHQRLLAVTDDTCHRGSNNIVGTITADNTDIGSTLIRFGTTGGDVSLTLGLRHPGNMPDKVSSFSVTNFGGEQDLSSANEIIDSVKEYVIKMENESISWRRRTLSAIDATKSRTLELIESTLQLSNLDVVASFLLKGESSTTLPATSRIQNEILGPAIADTQNLLGDYVTWLQSNNAREGRAYKESFEKKWPSITFSDKNYPLETYEMLRKLDELSLRAIENLSANATSKQFEREVREVFLETFGGLGAAGLSASLLTSILPTTLEDLLALGLCSAGGFIAISNFPARRQGIIEKVKKTADALGQELEDAMQKDLQETTQNLEKFVRIIGEPYRDAAQNRLDKLLEVNDELSNVRGTLKMLQVEIQNLHVS